MKLFKVSEEEKEKLNEMNKMQKLGYIWDYYKLWIIGVVVLIFLVIYFSVLFVNRANPAKLHISFVNFYDDVSENSDLYKAFMDYSGSEIINGPVNFDSNVFFDLSKTSDYANEYFQKLVAYLEAGTTHAAVMQYDNLMGIAKGGRLMDLSDDRTKDIYNKYKDRLVYFETEEGVKLPVGIDITDSKALAKMENGYGEGKVYLAISAYIDEKDAKFVQIFIDYLLQD